METPDPELKQFERLAGTLLELQANGVNVVPVLSVQSNDGVGYIIQPRAKGSELYDRYRDGEKAYVTERVAQLSRTPQKHFDKLVADTISIVDAGILIDFNGKDNFFTMRRRVFTLLT